MRKLATLVMVLLCAIVSARAQKTSINGTVINSKGDGIAGASIREKGSKKGVSANSIGIFTFSVAPGTTLVVSATGYAEKEVIATANMSVQLTEENKDLSEVIVTAQGLRRRPKELGYSVTSVSNAEITNGKSPQLANGLAGKVSGLAVYNLNNSVDPSVKITLRGYRSISG